MGETPSSAGRRTASQAFFVDSIVCGDKEVLSRLPDKCVDLVLTSPPYNFGLSYRKGTTGSTGKSTSADSSPSPTSASGC